MKSKVFRASEGGLTCIAVLLAVCVFVAPTLANKRLAGIDAKWIGAHVKFLSSDALEARGMGQKGSDLAADYIAEQLKQEGLKPAGEDGTFFQKVPMVA